MSYHMLFMQCDNCGYAGTARGRIGEAVKGGVQMTCPRCRTLAPLYQFPNVPDVQDTFLDRTARALESAKISKKQAKRALRKISDARDISKLPASLATIDQRLETPARDAINSSEPDRRLKQLALIVAIVGGVVTTTLAGLQIAEILGYFPDVEEIDAEDAGRAVSDARALRSELLSTKPSHIQIKNIARPQTPAPEYPLPRIPEHDDPHAGHNKPSGPLKQKRKDQDHEPNKSTDSASHN